MKAKYLYIIGILVLVLLIFYFGWSFNKSDTNGKAIVTGLINPPSDCGCGWAPADSNMQWK